MSKPKNINICGYELFFDENNLLSPQIIKKSLLAAIYYKSLWSFNKEIEQLKERLAEKREENYENSDDSYIILLLGDHKKVYNKTICEIIFKFFGTISYEEVNENYKKIKIRYLKNIKKYKSAKK